MDTMSLLYIVVAAILGVTITYFLLKKKVEVKDVSTTSSEDQDLVKKYEQQLQESNIKGNELKEKLTEANAKIAMLDEQLNEAVNGNLDEVAKKRLAEVDKLKKEIMDLECEIEEYEDDIKDLKKKLKNKEAENSKLQDDLSKEQRVCKQLCQDLEVVKNDLEDKSKDLKLKAES